MGSSINNGNKTDFKGYLIIFAVIVIILYLFFGGSGGSSSGTRSKKCGSCNRTFTDATNINYIVHTNLCRNCYRNFCWSTGKTPTNYDK